MKICSPLKSNFWIIAILAAGVCYSLALQWLTPDEVFYTGDNGMKALLTQQLAAGNSAINLEFPAQPWIKVLWADGMYPYQEPFVYQLAGKYYSQYTYFFSLITTPFYAFLGYRGLYVIPWLATLVIWLVFYRVCKKLDLGTIAIAIGVAILIFATNLTFYSAMYWEHTLSVCLSFTGLSLVLPSKSSNSIKFWSASWAGILTGLAVWFREEQIFLVIFLDLLSLWALLKPHWRLRSIKYVDFGMIPHFMGKSGWFYLVTSSLIMILYGLTNWFIYQNFFGVHAIQVIEHQPLLERFITAVGNFQLMTVGYNSLFFYVPIALFPLGYLCITWLNSALVEYKQEWTIWYVFCLAFILAVAVVVPPSAGGKQWGPRLLLLLVPVIVLLFTVQLDRLLRNLDGPNKTFRSTGLALALILGVIGVAQNPLRGTIYLYRTYAQIKPAVEILQAAPESVITISHQWIAQILQPAVGRDVVFLWVTDEDQVAQVSEALLSQGQDFFTYICLTGDCQLFNLNTKTVRVERNGVGYILRTFNSGEYGYYTILSIRVDRSY